jgi:pseudouridine-5'-phosphate glycosidase
MLLSAVLLSTEVDRALQTKQPVVALESTVITHGLPFPENQALALDMEAEVRQNGAVPATIAVVQGMVHIGVNQEQLEHLARGSGMRKISTRDFALAIAMKYSGGTTVAGTMLAAHSVGIRVLATGGIGGVHRQPPFDISADLPQLASTPMVVVCAGAKAILDLPATLEYLETVGVPVIGYQTDEFPAFYSRSSGLPTSGRADSPAQIGEIAQAHWSIGMRSALLVVQPPPAEDALPVEQVEGAIQIALQEAEMQQVRGQAVTPFLLKRVSELTHGASLEANLGLLKNNARLAASIAHYL